MLLVFVVIIVDGTWYGSNMVIVSLVVVAVFFCNDISTPLELYHDNVSFIH